MSHDGSKFTYVNQLSSSDTDLSKREAWFTCACCPPNVLRLFGQIGGYVWQTRILADGGTGLAVHLYVSSTLTLDVGGQQVHIKQESDWPWKSDIKFSIHTSAANLSLKLRIPAWATSFRVSTTSV
jgi:DUF1680 family protein